MITSWKAMGTTVEVHTATSADADRGVAMFAEAEHRFSRFLPHSELSRLNASGPGKHAVSVEMREVLTIAAGLEKLTDGLVDPGVGGALIDLGYSTSFEKIGDVTGHRPARHRRGGWSLDDDSVLLDGDVQLDLGGIVKGWTCDRVVECGVASIASAGGDLRSSDPDLYVEVVDADGDIAAEVLLGAGGFATSSRTKRRWKVGSEEAHHLIDPRTMAPAITPVVSASVATMTAVEAEAGAKAVLLCGSDGLAWADRQDWIAFALAIWHDGNVYGTRVRVAS